MKLLSASVAALLGVQAQEERVRTKFADSAYSMDLPCGDCVASGWNYLWKSEETGLVVNDEEYPTNTGKFADTDVMCCEGSVDFYSSGDRAAYNPATYPAGPGKECAEILRFARGSAKTEWRQSDSFTSNSYAMSMCPFRKSSCGPNSLINFYTSQDDGAIHVIGLKKGESCTYNIESVCGAPSFKISNSTNVEIIYNEWQQDSVSIVLPVTNSMIASPDIMRASPSADTPARNVDFLIEGSSEEGGPIYGKYAKNGWKAWNNDKQDTQTDADVIGRRYLSADNECKLRNTMITVLATENDAQLLIELKSAKFSAVYIKNAILAFAATSFVLLQ